MCRKTVHCKIAKVFVYTKSYISHDIKHYIFEKKEYVIALEAVVLEHLKTPNKIQQEVY